jgi:predicted Fe-Mo cluster-binding NifX family protein
MSVTKNPDLIKLAIPTNDGDTIFNRMLGQADFFNIYEIDKKGYKLIEKRPNQYAKTLQHLKTLDVYQALKDCNVIISSKIGKKGIERLKERHIKLIFKSGGIEDVLEKIITNNTNFLFMKDNQ